MSSYYALSSGSAAAPSLAAGAPAMGGAAEHVPGSAYAAAPSLAAGAQTMGGAAQHVLLHPKELPAVRPRGQPHSQSLHAEARTWTNRFASGASEHVAAQADLANTTRFPANVPPTLCSGNMDGWVVTYPEGGILPLIVRNLNENNTPCHEGEGAEPGAAGAGGAQDSPCFPYGGAGVHRSHRCTWRRGILFCDRCGAYTAGARGGKRIGQKCENAPTAASRSCLSRLLKGLPPPGYKFPLEPEARPSAAVLRLVEGG